MYSTDFLPLKKASFLLRLAVQTFPIVDAFEDLIELMVCCVGELSHWSATGFLNATPVEVVPNIQNEGWILFGCMHLHRRGDQCLGLIVNSLHKTTSWVATNSHGLVAHHKLLVITQLLGMCLIPPGAWKDTRSCLCTLWICNQFWSAFDGAQRAIHTSPVTLAVKICEANEKQKIAKENLPLRKCDKHL